VAVVKTLVTGATGFVGTVLTAELEHRGHMVVRALRTGAGARPHDVMVGDLGEDIDWRNALDGVDTVFHLAARVHVMGAEDRDLEPYRRINVEATEQLARASVAAGVRRIVFLSSVKAAGEGGKAAMRESEVGHPSDPYGITKLEAERRLKEITNGTATSVVAVRSPLVYGPGVRANFLSLLRAVDRGIPLPFGRIENRRSLIFVRNLADALIHCSGSGAGTFYASDGEDVSTPELIRRVAKALGRKGWMLPVPPVLLSAPLRTVGRAAADRLLGSLYVDISTIRATGWAPPFTLDQGLAETVTWYREDGRGKHAGGVPRR
jgi:nucleoside-diphosphate-sugar epimerase